MQLVLTVTSEQAAHLGQQAQFAFGENGGSIGRNASNEWVLPDPTKTVSGCHAVIRFSNGVFSITDTSTNGVFVDNDQVPIGRNQSVMLKGGETILIGHFQVRAAISAVGSQLGIQPISPGTPALQGQSPMPGAAGPDAFTLLAQSQNGKGSSNDPLDALGPITGQAPRPSSPVHPLGGAGGPGLAPAGQPPAGAIPGFAGLPLDQGAPSSKIADPMAGLDVTTGHPAPVSPTPVAAPRSPAEPVLSNNAAASAPPHPAPQAVPSAPPMSAPASNGSLPNDFDFGDLLAAPLSPPQPQTPTPAPQPSPLPTATAAPSPGQLPEMALPPAANDGPAASKIPNGFPMPPANPFASGDLGDAKPETGNPFDTDLPSDFAASLEADLAASFGDIGGDNKAAAADPSAAPPVPHHNASHASETEAAKQGQTASVGQSGSSAAEGPSPSMDPLPTLDLGLDIGVAAAPQPGPDANPGPGPMPGPSPTPAPAMPPVGAFDLALDELLPPVGASGSVSSAPNLAAPSHAPVPSPGVPVLPSAEADFAEGLSQDLMADMVTLMPGEEGNRTVDPTTITGKALDPVTVLKQRGNARNTKSSDVQTALRARGDNRNKQAAPPIANALAQGQPQRPTGAPAYPANGGGLGGMPPMPGPAPSTPPMPGGGVMPAMPLPGAGLAPVAGYGAEAQQGHGTADTDIFFSALGIDASRLSEQDKKDMLEALGCAMRINVQGMIEVLSARKMVKSELSLEQTSLRPQGNNPLKFFKSADDVFFQLYVKKTEGFMPIDRSFEEAFDNMKEHEMASMMGIRSAIEGVLNKLNPKVFEQEARGFLGKSKDKAWERFVQAHEALFGDIDNAMREIVGAAVSDAFRKDRR